MIKKIFLLGFALLAVGQLMMAQSYNMIVLGVDGNKTTCAVSNVQKVLLKDNGTMTVELKDGSSLIGTSVSFKEATGIKDLKADASVSAFPNPVQETLMVNGIQKGAVIDIYSISGVLLQSVTSQENSMNINVASLQQGIYLLRIDSQIIKFIKK